MARVMRLPLANMKEVIGLYNGDIGGMYIPKVRVTNKSIFNEVMSHDSSSNTYTVSAKSGEKMVMVCASCRDEGEVMCWWCPYSLPIENNVGIVVSLSIDGDKYKTDTTGYTCSEECSLAFVLNEKKKGKDTPRQYVMSDYYHRTLHNMLYPNDGPLIPAKDPNLLKIRGGSLTREQWLDKRHVYVENPYMTVVRYKSSYMKMALR